MQETRNAICQARAEQNTEHNTRKRNKDVWEEDQKEKRHYGRMIAGEEMLTQPKKKKKKKKLTKKAEQIIHKVTRTKPTQFKVRYILTNK